MNNIYANNQEITDFITKAQNKIADLSTLLVERAGDITPLDILALELIDFIEALDNPLTSWTLNEVIRWVDEYSYRTNLGELSYLNIYGYNTTLIQNILGNNGSITTDTITDFELAVNDLIRRFPHNNLAQIQGGLPNERYHVDKTMYDLLYDLAHPNSPSSVSLTLTTNGNQYPSGYYELGTSIEVVNLVGAITYGTEKKANYFEYDKNGVLYGTRNSNPTTNLQPNPTSDTTGIKVDTTYLFKAEFKDGVKIDTKSVLFRQPMYYGIIKANNYTNTTELLKGTKLVRDKGEMTLSFTLPTGNTLTEDYYIPYLFVPNSWGMIVSAINGPFDFRPDFSDFGRDMPLLDGSLADGRIIINTTQLEGVVIFKFNW